MLKFLFSFDGRISRKMWWISQLVLVGIAVAVFGIPSLVLNTVAPDQQMNPPLALSFVLFWFALIMYMWIGLACQVKRLHDLNKPWPWIFIAVIPAIGTFWMLGLLGLRRGTQGPNRFGPDPLET